MFVVVFFKGGLGWVGRFGRLVFDEFVGVCFCVWVLVFVWGCFSRDLPWYGVLLWCFLMYLLRFCLGLIWFWCFLMVRFCFLVFLTRLAKKAGKCNKHKL